LPLLQPPLRYLSRPPTLPCNHVVFLRPRPNSQLRSRPGDPPPLFGIYVFFVQPLPFFFSIMLRTSRDLVPLHLPQFSKYLFFACSPSHGESPSRRRADSMRNLLSAPFWYPSFRPRNSPRFSLFGEVFPCEPAIVSLPPNQLSSLFGSF